MVHSNEKKEQAVVLRTLEKFSLRNISKKLDIPVTTLSGWLKDFPLKHSEIESNRIQSMREAKIKKRLPESIVSTKTKRVFTRSDKGLLAEAAIRLRLLMHGFEVFTPLDGNSKIDLICLAPETKAIYKIQIKWCSNQSANVGTGLPYIKLTHYTSSTLKEKYDKSQCDFFIGYDFRTDSAYVVSFEETENKSTFRVSESCREMWGKIR